MTPAALRSKARSFKRAFGPIMWVDLHTTDEEQFEMLFTPEGDYHAEVQRELDNRVKTARLIRILDDIPVT
jgi:hypothetical protein